MSVELVYVDDDWLCGETDEWLVWLTMAVDGRRTQSLVQLGEGEGWSSQNVKMNKGAQMNTLNNLCDVIFFSFLVASLASLAIVGEQFIFMILFWILYLIGKTTSKEKRRVDCCIQWNFNPL